MFSFLSAVINSMSSNLDNFVIGIAFGIKKIKIGFLPNLLIALITVAGTVASMYAGKIAASFLPRGLTDLLGASIIILLGLYFVLQSFSNLLNRKKRIRSIALKDADSMIDYAQDSDKDVSGSIDIRESAAVGCGLAFNNIGTGIAASAAGVQILQAAVCTFLFSIFFLILGVYLGDRIFGRVLGKYAPLLSGILLIALGIIELTL